MLDREAWDQLTTNWLDLWPEDWFRREAKVKERLFGKEIVRRWRVLLRAQQLADKRDLELGQLWQVAQKLYGEDPDLEGCFGSFDCFWGELRTGNGYTELFTQWEIPASSEVEWNELLIRIQRLHIAQKLVATAKNKLVTLMNEKTGDLVSAGLLPATSRDEKQDTERELDQQLSNMTRSATSTPLPTDSEISEISQSLTEDSVHSELTPSSTQPESRL